MKKFIEEFGKQLKEAIEQAAHDSYYENDKYYFDGCSCLIDLLDDDQIEVGCDKHGRHEVRIYKDTELPNLEEAIADYLDANADPEGAWQEEYDGDMWRDVDYGCDPAFPHRGDFERWAYGR
ncbi:hypothetical protein [Prevotella sp. HUN102]|uniref:hypothetical protein n=1 Tax=Prevotella sp. HUN102 TaxID=1392486 RepID=UPI00048ABD56|nr:hypothetical protein [Prevotella sp. HUN102]